MHCNAASVKHISGKEGMRVPVESSSKLAFTCQQKALVIVRQAEADWAWSEGGRVFGREMEDCQSASSFLMAYGGRRENASRSSSIQESGFSFLNLCKGSQIHGFGVLHFLIFSVQRNGIPSSQTIFALFYSQFGDRGAFSPWGKLFCYSPRVHPGGHSLLLAPLQTQHLIWIGVLAISYWLSKKLTISNGGWFEI